MSDARLLELTGIDTCYGRSQVLFGLSLAIAPGEMVTLMGRNGMGKTTTVRAIMGLTPATAGSGRSSGPDRGLAWLPWSHGVVATTPATLMPCRNLRRETWLSSLASGIMASSSAPGIGTRGWLPSGNAASAARRFVVR